MATPWLDRFYRKVDRTTSPKGCWIWVGAYNTPRGRHSHTRTPRPVFWLATGHRPGVVVYAHRLILSHVTGIPYDCAYEAAHRPVSCGDVRCVNPDPAHVYWATADENRADRYGIDR